MPEDAEQEQARFAALYEQMSDAELETIAADAPSLTNAARQVLQSELTKRGLEIELGSPEPEMVPEFSELVSIRAFRDLPEALLAKGKLDAAGVESYIMDQNMIRMNWFISTLLGGVKLCVKADDAERALDFLEEPIPDQIELENGETFTQPKCPRCNSLDISSAGAAAKSAYVAAWALAPIPLQRKTDKCLSCGYEWKTDHTVQESGRS